MCITCNHNNNKKRDSFASILLSRSAQSHLRIQKMLHSPISTDHREKLWQEKNKRDICVHEERQLFNQWQWWKKRSLLLGLTNSICSSMDDWISPLRTALLVMPNLHGCIIFLGNHSVMVPLGSLVPSLVSICICI